MVKFGKKFRSEINLEWKKDYIDYKSLKKIIRQTKEDILKEENKERNIEFTPNQEINIQSPSLSDNTSLKLLKSDDFADTEKVLDDKLKNFFKILDIEIKKIYLFFVTRERELYILINSHLHIRQTYKSFNLRAIAKEYEELFKISLIAYNITKFIDLNMIALKKILKKFDKKFETFYGRVSLRYIQKKLESKNSDLLYILQFKIIDEVNALLEDLMCDLKSKYDSRRQSEVVCSSIKKENINSSLVKTYSHDQEKMENLLKIEISEDFTLSEANMIESINWHIRELEKNIISIDEHNQNFKNNFKEWSHFLKQNAKTYSNIYSVTNKTSLNGNSIKDKENFGFETVDVKSKLKVLPRRVSLDTEILLSQENNTNIYLTLFHTFFFLFSFSIVIPTNVTYITYLGHNPILSGFVMSCTPIGTLISLFYTNKWINKSYRSPIVLSIIFILLGNFIYIFSSVLDSLIPMIVGRFLLGLGSNRVANRSYILEYVPKIKLNKYLFYFQLSSLTGIASGPLISILILFANNFGIQNSKFFNNYNTPSIICTIISIIFAVRLIIQYSEPLRSDFSIYRDNQIITDRSHSSVSQDGIAISKQEKIMIEEIDDKLSEINDKNQFSDTNLVARSIEQIAWRENKTASYLYKCFLVLVFILVVCRLTTESLIIISPFYIKDIDVNFSIIGIAFLISGALFMVIPTGFFFNYYLNYKIKDRKMLIYLLIATIVFNLLILNIFYTSLTQYCIIFVFLLITTNLLENVVTTMISKIIPSDYELQSFNAGYIIQIWTTIGRIIGAMMLTIAGVTTDENLNRITYGITLGLFTLALTVTVLYYRNLRVKAISRILRGRSVRKLKNSEF